MVYIYTDGASRGNGGDSASSYIITDGSREINRGVRYVGHVTNNMAEYFAVYDGVLYSYNNDLLRGYNSIVSDSQLIINQLKGNWKINNGDLKEINNIIRHYIDSSGGKFSYEWVPRTHAIIKECDRMNNNLLDSLGRSTMFIKKDDDKKYLMRKKKSIKLKIKRCKCK